MPRFLHRFYAWLFGYFWLPCEVCGRHFGGHEDGFGELLLEGDGTTQHASLTCSRCPHTYVKRDGQVLRVVPRLIDDRFDVFLTYPPR